MSQVHPVRALAPLAAKLCTLYGLSVADGELIAGLPCAERAVQAGSYWFGKVNGTHRFSCCSAVMFNGTKSSDQAAARSLRCTFLAIC